MIITIDLNIETEQAIERKARRLGISVSEYVTRMADRAAKPTRRTANDIKAKGNVPRPKTGAEVLDELKAMNFEPGYGDPNIDSPELALILSAAFSRPKRDNGSLSQ